MAPQTLVVVDEAYLECDAFAARSAIRFVRAGSNVVVFRTLAKIYGLAGLSIGYAVAPCVDRGSEQGGLGSAAFAQPPVAAGGRRRAGRSGPSVNVKLRAMQMVDVAAQPRMGSKAIKV